MHSLLLLGGLIGFVIGTVLMDIAWRLDEYRTRRQLARRRVMRYG